MPADARELRERTVRRKHVQQQTRVICYADAESFEMTGAPESLAWDVAGFGERGDTLRGMPRFWGEFRQ